MDAGHLIAWGGFLAFVLFMLALDLFVLHRNAHEIRMKEALIGVSIPVVTAMLFTIFIYFAYQNHWLNLGYVPTDVAGTNKAQFFPTDGKTAAIFYLTGYIVELSLSADNVFLFVVLMNFFVVPAALQHRVLFWGVLGALVMRAVMIIVGAELLRQFDWIIYIFGAFLLFTGIKMLFSDEDDVDPGNSFAVRMAKKVLPIHPAYDAGNFFTRIHGKLFATSLFVVLVCIEFTDLVFALDSIPAIFGITQDSFIVFTSNVFAILGLRSMYFVLAGVMDKFHLLKYGLSVVLAFVGIKMLVPGAGRLYALMTKTEDPHWHVNMYLSLGIIISALVVSVAASLLFPKKDHIHNPLENP